MKIVKEIGAKTGVIVMDSSKLGVLYLLLMPYGKILSRGSSYTHNYLRDISVKNKKKYCGLLFYSQLSFQLIVSSVRQTAFFARPSLGS